MRETVEILLSILISAVVYGAIPVFFVLSSGIIAFQRYRRLLPVVAALCIHLASCYIMLWEPSGNMPVVPGVLTLEILSVMIPAIVAIAGITWTLLVSQSLREKWWGIAIAVVGSGLTALNAFMYIQLVWYAI